MFALQPAPELHDVYPVKIEECDRELDNALVEINRDRSTALKAHNPLR